MDLHTCAVFKVLQDKLIPTLLRAPVLSATETIFIVFLYHKMDFLNLYQTVISFSQKLSLPRLSFQDLVCQFSLS